MKHKKWILCAAAGLLLLTTASCQKSDTENQQPNVITVAMSLPETAPEWDTLAAYQRLTEDFQTLYPDCGIALKLYADGLPIPEGSDLTFQEEQPDINQKISGYKKIIAQHFIDYYQSEPAQNILTALSEKGSAPKPERPPAVQKHNISETVPIPMKVPDCAELSISEARTALENAGLICMAVYLSAEDKPLDMVISQSPPAGSTVFQGSQVWLNVSVGSANAVISTGGWSGNPLPSFHLESDSETESLTEPETEPLTEAQETAPPPPPEPELVEPDPVPPEPQEQAADPVIETPPETESESESFSESDFADAPEIAPFAF